MENLTTLVYNKTDAQLIFKAFKNGEEADLKEIRVGANETKTILFEKLFKEKTQQIHVINGDNEQVLEILNRHDFPDEKELLVFQMENESLQFEFVQWTWSEFAHIELELLLINQRKTGKLRTKVDNKSELDLKFIDVYNTGVAGEAPYCGTMVMEVPAKSRKTIPSGIFYELHKAQNIGTDTKCTQDIYVTNGDSVVMVINSDDFQANQGKELVLDTQENHFGFAFLQPQTTSWKNWLCFSKTRKSQDMDLFA